VALDWALALLEGVPLPLLLVGPLPSPWLLLFVGFELSLGFPVLDG
jgi:hypothetical protein